jgi:hypothetical protein
MSSVYQSVGNPEFSSWGWEISARISCIVINLYTIYHIHIFILTHLRVIQSNASYTRWLVIHIVETNNYRLTIMKAATFYRILIFLLLNSSLCKVFTLQVSGSIWVSLPAPKIRTRRSKHFGSWFYGMFGAAAEPTIVSSFSDYFFCFKLFFFVLTCWY